MVTEQRSKDIITGLAHIAEGLQSLALGAKILVMTLEEEHDEYYGQEETAETEET